MEPFDSLEKLINEKGSAAVLLQHLEFLKSQMAAKDEALLKKDAQIREMQARILTLEASFRPITQKPADHCPFCRQPAGELIEIKPSPISDFAVIGVRQGYYRCSNCGKEYDKEMS
ncbi:MAG: hypothetical protein AB1705_04325 [Verrucomicrobiota bacterium]